MKKLFTFIVVLNLLCLTAFAVIRDEFVEQTLDKNLKIKPRKVVVVDKTTMTPVHVRMKQPFTTKWLTPKSQENIKEGDIFEFELAEEVTIRNKTYPEGTPVLAKLETVSMNDIMGVPADVEFGSFTLDGIPLGGLVKKTGANRTYWVYPCINGVNTFFALGYAFMPVRGGHAKIKPTETFTLYAE